MDAFHLIKKNINNKKMCISLPIVNTNIAHISIYGLNIVHSVIWVKILAKSKNENNLNEIKNTLVQKTHVKLKEYSEKLWGFLMTHNKLLV